MLCLVACVTSASIDKSDGKSWLKKGDWQKKNDWTQSNDTFDKNPTEKTGVNKDQWINNEKGNRLLDESKNLSKDNDSRPEDKNNIRACCKALTAQCLSCSAGVSVEEFCKKNP